MDHIALLFVLVAERARRQEKEQRRRRNEETTTNSEPIPGQKARHVMRPQGKDYAAIARLLRLYGQCPPGLRRHRSANRRGGKDQEEGGAEGGEEGGSLREGGEGTYTLQMVINVSTDKNAPRQGLQRHMGKPPGDSTTW